MAHSKERFASFLKKELGIFLSRHFPHDPDVFLSVVSVSPAESSERAKIYIAVFPENRSSEIWKELKFYQKDAKKYLAERIKRRRVPQIIFLPVNAENLVRLEKLLEKVKNE